MKKALIKDGVKEITYNIKRFLSILLVVLLGVGFFAGIKATSPDMKETLDVYMDNQNFMDIQVISTLGLTDDDITTLQGVEGVESATGTYSADGIISLSDEDFVVKLETITEGVNQPVLVEGQLPSNLQECVVEKSFLTGTEYKIGDTIELKTEDITDDDGNEKPLLKQEKLKIVGTVESPMYISRERGSSKLGSGRVQYYLYVSPELINTNMYTAVYIRVNGAEELNCTTTAYTDLVENVKDKIDEIADDRREARYNEIYDKANKKIQDARKELEDETEKANKEIQDAEDKIEAAKKELETGREELASNRNKANTQFANAQNQIESAEKELKEGTSQFEEAKKQAQKEINENKDLLQTLKDTRKTYNNTNNTLTKKQKELSEVYEKLENLDPITDGEQIAKLQKELQELSKDIYVLNATKTTIENELKNQGISIESLGTTISKIETAIDTAEEELDKQEQKLQQGKKQLETQKKTLASTKSSTYAQLAEAEKELAEGEKELQENEKKLEDSKKEMQEKIADAEEELEKAEIELEDIEKPEWYILDREQNTGYASYVQDTDRVANLATVFPVIFFVVAALISLTSMSRMVEEERVQIGTFKALGYTKLQIASKYIIYAVLSTIIGSGIGLSIGFRLLPSIIADMYANMYTLPEVILEFNTVYALVGTISALACTLGATIYSIVKVLHKKPAELMRPKSPKLGKRVILEKIPFIWKRLNFTQKVTARNIFRYKKRFLMTIIGVMGCTALILAGFGLRDAITKMLPSQYGEIFKYNVQISLKDSLTSKVIQEAQDKVNGYEGVANSIKADMQSIEILDRDNNQNIQLIVPENTEELNNFIVLKSRTNSEQYNLSDEGIIITEKLAKLLDIKEGDSIKLKDANDDIVETKVQHITENYLMHYIYMSPELYKNLYNKDFKANTILVNTAEITTEQETTLGSKILEDENAIAGVTFLSDTEDMFKDVMENMNFVVLILIISAGLLAFVVLYNLSNTNISERIRELATIKVLGFYDKEVNGYVGRETNILTGIGIALGLVAGYFLTMYIVKTCELDILMFDRRLEVWSFVYAAIITIVFAVIVNITTHFALKKIDMIESLKSVE